MFAHLMNCVLLTLKDEKKMIDPIVAFKNKYLVRVEVPLKKSM